MQSIENEDEALPELPPPIPSDEDGGSTPRARPSEQQPVAVPVQQPRLISKLTETDSDEEQEDEEAVD